MGWLRELMAATDPAIASYGDLARRCLDNRDWPRDIQPQARSLASLFSKFDRGIEVEWLGERREVQYVLAQTLSLPLRTVEQEVAKHLGQADRAQSRFRFYDAPKARPLDLREEDLPDVFDERLTRPGLWERLWWVAPAGGGEELLGKWLQARALADFTVCTTWQEVVNASRTGVSPVFIEYRSVPPSAADVAELGSRKLCVVAPHAAPPGFEVVHGVDIDVAELALIRWLEPLWVQPADVPSQELRAWLARLRSAQLGTNIEAMLGLMALAYDVGLAKVESLTPTELVQFFLTRAIDQTSFASSTEGPWLKDHVYEVLRGTARNALTTCGTDWNTPQSQADWLALVPSEYQRGVDAEWTRVSLQQAGAPLTVSELEKALRAVPPGGFRVVESLRTAQILRTTESAKLTLKPRWVADFFERAGYSSLLEESADAWGKVALGAPRTNGIIDALNREYAALQFRALDAALELDDDSSPGYALAVELLVLTAGRWLLLGNELEPEQIGGLLRLQQGQLVQRVVPVGAVESKHAPSPRLLAPPSDTHRRGQWLLSMWALCEHASDLPELTEVNPWATQPNFDEATLSLLSYALGEAGPEVLSAAYAMFGRLLQHLERTAETSPSLQSLVQVCSAHPLFAVARVLRGDGWDAWELSLRAHMGVQSVRVLVTQEAWPYLAKTAWRTWSEKGSPHSGLSLFASNTHRQLFWPYLQDRVLRALLDERHPIVLQAPSECMKAEWVTMYLERVPEQDDLARQYLELIPMSAITEEHFEVLFELLEGHAFAERVVGLWQSHVSAAYQRLVSLLDAGKSNQAKVWLSTVPESELERLVGHLGAQVERLGTRYPSFETCRLWLHDLCCRRSPGWLRAYDLFSDMELRLKRVARVAPATITPADSP